MKTTKMSAQTIAKMTHQVNKVYCESTGDMSQPDWYSAPKWQRDSAIAGVEFHLAEPRTPEESHESWLAHKEADGWVYGDVKDPEKKEHPCMRPYSELPEEQRAKDHLFGGIVELCKGIS